MLPALAKANGIDFDEIGISVCSIGGTNFRPYLEFLGENGLRLPVAVVTDGDPTPNGDRRGHARALRLLQDVIAPADRTDLPHAEQIQLARTHGFFVGDHTSEIDVFRSGGGSEILETLLELAPGNAAARRARAWQHDPNTLDPDQLLKDITVIGKGRFAQRLSSRITAHSWPNYMQEAVSYVCARCR